MVVMGEVEMPCKYQYTQKHERETVAWLPCKMLFAGRSKAESLLERTSSNRPARERLALTAHQASDGIVRAEAGDSAALRSQHLTELPIQTDTDQEGWQAVAVRKQVLACLKTRA